MKRFAFLTILLIVIASTTGCRRGLRLWGLRGAPCVPPVAAPTPVLPGAYAAPSPAYAPVVAPNCCPDVVQPAPLDCGCATEGLSYDPAYRSAPPVVSDSGYRVLPGETFGGDVGNGIPPGM